MTARSKEVILRAMQNAEGDDLERATAAFRGRTPEQMQQQYGQSGSTCAQIIDGYRRGARRVARSHGRTCSVMRFNVILIVVAATAFFVVLGWVAGR